MYYFSAIILLFSLSSCALSIGSGRGPCDHNSTMITQSTLAPSGKPTVIGHGKNFDKAIASRQAMDDALKKAQDMGWKDARLTMVSESWDEWNNITVTCEIWEPPKPTETK